MEYLAEMLTAQLNTCKNEENNRKNEGNFQLHSVNAFIIQAKKTP